MNWLLLLIHHLDVNVYYFLNQVVGNPTLDKFFLYQESNTLLKCGLLITLYWYFWFRGDPGQQERRKTIVTVIIGVLLALAVNRVASSMTPFRVRPMFDAALQHRPFSVQPIAGLENWSSYPSDHAAYLCALAFGLIVLARNFAIPMALYAALWICLPRMYLGVHYLSDIVVGALIGVVTVWCVLRSAWLRSSVASRVLAFAESKPQWFYMGAFLVMYEMGDLFWDVRGPVHVLMHAGAFARYRHILYGLVALTALGAAIAAAAVRKRGLIGAPAQDVPSVQIRVKTQAPPTNQGRAKTAAVPQKETLPVEHDPVDSLQLVRRNGYPGASVSEKLTPGPGKRRLGRP